MITKKLVDCYRYIMNVVLVLLLIAGPIAGGIIGKELSTYRANYSTVGILIGLLAALIFDFLIMPPILVLFEINEKFKKENTIIKEKTKTEINPETKPMSWLCKNCGEVNSTESTACGKCFAPRK